MGGVEAGGSIETSGAAFRDGEEKGDDAAPCATPCDAGALLSTGCSVLIYLRGNLIDGIFDLCCVLQKRAAGRRALCEGRVRNTLAARIE